MEYLCFWYIETQTCWFTTISMIYSICNPQDQKVFPECCFDGLFADHVQGSLTFSATFCWGHRRLSFLPWAVPVLLVTDGLLHRCAFREGSGAQMPWDSAETTGWEYCIIARQKMLDRIQFNNTIYRICQPLG